jgi:hypothetical protein
MFLASILLLAPSLYGVAAATPAVTSDEVSGDHCVGRLERISPASDHARIASQTCFSSFDDALRSVTDGPTGFESVESLPEGATLDGTEGAVVIGIDYDWPNSDSGHATYIWEAASGCTPTSGWIVNSMPFLWNDRVSSAKGFSGCTWYGHYEDINRGGSLRT